MVSLVKREGILVGIESTPDTEEALNPAAHSVMVQDLEFSYVNTRMQERNPLAAAFGKLPPAYGGSLGQLSFNVPLRGSGAAGTVPEFDALLRACAWSPDIVVSTSATYAFVSDSFEWATIYYYMDGLLRKLIGCVGTVELTWEVGSIGMLAFTMTGRNVDPVDAALPTFQYSDTPIGPRLTSAGLQVGGVDAVISSLTFTQNNQISIRPDPNKADGFAQLYVVDRDPVGSIDPQMTLVATDDPIADWKNGVAKSITTGVVGATAGNRVQLSIPTAYYTEMGYGDREGVRIKEHTFMAAGRDSAVSLAFT